MKIKVIFLTMAVFILAACSELVQRENQAPSPIQTEMYEVSDEAMYEEAAESDSQSSNTTERSIIYTANVSLETIEYDEAKQAIIDAVESAEGTIQYQEESTYQRSNYGETESDLSQLYLTIRVPQASYNDLLDTLEAGEIATVLQSSRGSEDVTQQVTDLDIRIESVESRIDRLNELNDEAETVAEMIEIETALQEAILERDQLLAEQSNLSDQVDLATISVSLREVMELSDRGGSQQTFWDELRDAAEETWYQAIDVFQGAILSIVFLLPYFIVILLILALLRWIVVPLIRLVRGKRKKSTTSNQPVKEYKVKEEKSLTEDTSSEDK